MHLAAASTIPRAQWQNSFLNATVTICHLIIRVTESLLLCKTALCIKFGFAVHSAKHLMFLKITQPGIM